MIHPVILSDGSGTRLWPMSRTLYPKQLLTLLGRDSLLQQDRAAGCRRRAVDRAQLPTSSKLLVSSSNSRDSGVVSGPCRAINHPSGGGRAMGTRSPAAPNLDAAADRPAFPVPGRPALRGCATSPASVRNRDCQSRDRRGATPGRQTWPACLPDPSRQSSTKARSAISASQRPRAIFPVCPAASECDWSAGSTLQ